VFTARYALSPYIKQIRIVFKGLKIRASFAEIGQLVQNVKQGQRNGHKQRQKKGGDLKSLYFSSFRKENMLKWAERKHSQSGRGCTVSLRKRTRNQIFTCMFTYHVFFNGVTACVGHGDSLTDFSVTRKAR
jgi:predicted Zn-dependent protease